MSHLSERFEGKARELIELLEKYDKIIDYLCKVDPELWKKQRLFLIELPDWRSQDVRITTEEIGLIEGLTGFLDGLTDLMADELGIKGLLLTEDEKEDGKEGEAEGP